jgi:hypothetical protein
MIGCNVEHDFEFRLSLTFWFYSFRRIRQSSGFLQGPAGFGEECASGFWSEFRADQQDVVAVVLARVVAGIVRDAGQL